MKIISFHFSPVIAELSALEVELSIYLVYLFIFPSFLLFWCETDFMQSYKINGSAVYTSWNIGYYFSYRWMQIKWNEYSVGYQNKEITICFLTSPKE